MMVHKRVIYIFFGLVIQLSESTDIFGIALRCLQFFAPHFKCNFENKRNELTHFKCNSHGGHLFTHHTIRNTGTNSTASCCSGLGQTHFVASSMVSMRFDVLAT
jgi:hypothetical protein